MEIILLKGKSTSVYKMMRNDSQRLSVLFICPFHWLCLTDDKQGQCKNLAFLLALLQIHAYIASLLDYFHSSLTGRLIFSLSPLSHCLKCTTGYYHIPG